MKNLFQMRSAPADRDQRERAERATPAPPIAVETKPADTRSTGSTTTTPAPVTGRDYVRRMTTGTLLAKVEIFRIWSARLSGRS